MTRHHALDYIEFPVKDVAAAKAFFGKVFGWKFNDYGPDYAGIQGEAREFGGLRKASDVHAGGPLVLMYSEDLTATLEAVKAAGGKILEPPYPYPGGQRFHFSDPGGLELGVYSEKA